MLSVNGGVVIEGYGGEILSEENFISDEFITGDLCMVFLFSRFISLDLTLGLCSRDLIVLFLVLWRERDGVSESLEAGGFVIAVIVVLVTVPKKP